MSRCKTCKHWQKSEDGDYQTEKYTKPYDPRCARHADTTMPTSSR